MDERKKEFVFQNSDPKKRYGNKDRLIKVLENVRKQDIDLSFRDNFSKVSTLISNAFNYVFPDGENYLEKKLDNIQLSRILSKANSDSQTWHTDFVGSWKNYFETFDVFGLVPLSILHFPEGKKKIILDLIYMNL